MNGWSNRRRAIGLSRPRRKADCHCIETSEDEKGKGIAEKMGSLMRGSAEKSAQSRRKKLHSRMAWLLGLCFFGPCFLGPCLLLSPAPLLAQSTVVYGPELAHLPQVEAGFACFYAMNYACAQKDFGAVAASHPGDPVAGAFLLNSMVFEELNRLDLLDTTFYNTNGFLIGNHLVKENPQTSAAILSLADQVVAEASAQLKQNPNNLDALFARGWARALEATYIAMAERHFGHAFHLAMDARSDSQHVLNLDEHYSDAKLVVGVYQYVMGALPWEFKLLLGFAGMHGSKTHGMELLIEDAKYGWVTNVEAQTARMLFLRREARYGEAIKIAQQMVSLYPHNYLFSLEMANLEKDKGLGMTAVYAYQHTLALANQAGYFESAHIELAYFGLGEALRGQNHYADAITAYKNAIAVAAVSPELKQRCWLGIGKTYDMAQNHIQAIEAYRKVIALGANSVEADKARQYLHSPY